MDHKMVQGRIYIPLTNADKNEVVIIIITILSLLSQVQMCFTIKRAHLILTFELVQYYRGD